MHSVQVGVTLPLDGLELTDHRWALDRLWQAGFTEVSTGEVDRTDAISPLVLFSVWRPELILSCAVVPVFTRGPALLAMTAASVADAAPGRVRFGIGSGSDRIVERWNGITFDRPYQRVADTLRFLREVLQTGHASQDAERAVGSQGFRLGRVPRIPPKLYLGALGPRMQRLAAAQADGVFYSFLAPADVAKVRAEATKTIREVDGALDTTVRLFVVPGFSSATEIAARRQLAAYLTVPVYRNYMSWLGRGDLLQPMVSAWDAGRRDEAMRAVPAKVLEELIACGTPNDCALAITRYLRAGVGTVTLALLSPHEQEIPIDEQIRFLCEIPGHVDYDMSD